MAQPAGVIDGSLVRILIGGNEVAYATNCTFSMTRNTTDRVHKDLSSGQVEKKLQESTATMSGEAFYSYDGTNNTYDVFFDAFVAKTELTCKKSTENSGDVEYTFSAFVTSLESSHEAQQDSTFSFTLDIDGAITKATIA